MNTYPAKNIINVAMAGHSGAGKTSLAEAMLYLAGASDRRGKVGEGNTVCDSDPEEIRRKTSTSRAVCMKPHARQNPLSSCLQARAAFPSVRKRLLRQRKSAACLRFSS